MRKYLATFLLLWAFVSSTRAQFLDSIRSALSHKGKFTLSLDSYSSFIDNDDADISGFLVGVNFGNRLTIGGGFNSLVTKITRNQPTEGGSSVSRQINFGFLCYYIQYQLNITKHWEINIPLKIGLGTSSYTYYAGGQQLTANSEFVMPVQPSVEVDYNFNKYWGLYVDAGYRWMLVNNNSITANFNSPIYDFGLFVCPFEIYAALFPKTKLAHLIEDN